MTTRHYPAGSDVTYTYDYNGRKTAMQDGVADTVYAWDSYGGVTCYDHLVAVRRKYGSMTTYRDTISQYDASYNRTSLRDGEGNVTTYAYDSLNRLTGMAYAGQTASFSYDAAGNRSGKTLPNGAYTEYDYNSRNMLTELRNRKSDATIISSYAYGLDDAGNRTSVTEANGDVTSYGYDDCDRLTGEVKRDSQNTVLYSYGYTYDDAGNRLTMTKDGVGTTYTYDAANKLLQYVDSDGTTTFGYDNNGNTTSVDPPGAVAWAYGYNYENLLTSVTDNNGYTAAYSYSADGLRLRAQESSHQYPDRWLQYDGVRPVLEGTLSGDGYATTARYEWEGETYYSPLVSLHTGGAWRQPLFDGLSSLTQLTDDSQAVTDRYEYDAFGVSLLSSPSSGPYGYGGYVGYYRAPDATIQIGVRQYLPLLGRVLQLDPLPYANRYAYVGSMPTRYIDPDGRARQRCCFFIPPGALKDYLPPGAHVPSGPLYPPNFGVRWPPDPPDPFAAVEECYNRCMVDTLVYDGLIGPGVAGVVGGVLGREGFGPVGALCGLDWTLFRAIQACGEKCEMTLRLW